MNENQSPEKPKQIIVVRKDLNMRKGKIASQAAHASMAAVLNQGWYEGDNVPGGTFRFHLPLANHAVMRVWLSGSFTKICVYVNSEQELLDVVEAAKDAGLIHALITDSGLTEFKGVPTRTCCAIGPAYPSALQPVTGHLPLL